MACVLVLGSVAIFVSGCKEEEKIEEQPAEAAAPKDHPAH